MCRGPAGNTEGEGETKELPKAGRWIRKEDFEAHIFHRLCIISMLIKSRGPDPCPC